MVRVSFLALLGVSSIAGGWEKTAVPEDFVMPSPLPVAESIASIKALHGFAVELVASEPLVRDPVAIDFGPDGKIWVVEMADYPLGMDGKNQPGGRVRFLEDKDRDGIYESSTLFLDGLNFPTGVKVWRDGVLIIACPEILYARDTDGDGKADEKEILFHGFREGNQQHRVNGFAWGLDNWLHLANGDSGGAITSTKTGETLVLGSFDLKIRPDTGEMKLTAGRTQYGRVRDDFGNWFGNNNSKPLWQYVLSKEITDLNPHTQFENRIHQVPEVPVAPRIFPASQTTFRFNNPRSASHITSACGISVIRDSMLGSAFYGNALICEPVHNLVHRQVLQRDGLVFQGKRAAEEKESEFLRSTDHWFRPVYSTTGPDGAVWVVDMHRYVIEHPEWIPQPWQDVLDLRAGADLGRIYRVRKPGEGRAYVRMKSLNVVALLEKLDSKNGWVRDMAHQQLLWRAPSVTSEPVLNGWASLNTTLGKIHFLSLVDWLGEGVPGVLLHEAMTSGRAELQQFALTLLDENNANPAVLAEVERLARSAEEPTRFQALVALGQVSKDEAGAFLAELLPELDSESYDLAAIATALPNHLAIIASAVDEESESGWLVPLFETAVAVGNEEVIASLLAADHPQAVLSFLSVLERRRTPFETFLSSAKPELKADLVSRIMKLRRQVDPENLTEQEMALFGALKTNRESDIQTLNSLVGAARPPQVVVSALEALVRLESYQFLEKWNQVSPTVRDAMFQKGAQREPFCSTFLDAIERGKIPAPTISVAARDRLTGHKNPEIKERASRLLGKVDSDREAVVDRFSEALSIKGSPTRGREVFRQTCAVCHEFRGDGNAIGADLAALAAPSPESLLIAILDPNRAVEDKYLLHSLTLNDGIVLNGMILSETTSTIEFQSMDGRVQQIPRREIVTLQNTGRSAMLEGLESVLDPVKMADLLAYILEES